MRPEAERLLAKIDAGEVTLDEDGILWLQRDLKTGPVVACEQAGHIYSELKVTEGSFARGQCIICGDVLVGSPGNISNVAKARCACGHRGGAHEIAGKCLAVVEHPGFTSPCQCPDFRPAPLDADERKHDQCEYQTGHDFVDMNPNAPPNKVDKLQRCTLCGITQEDDGIPF